MASTTSTGADRMSKHQSDWESIPAIHLSLVIPSKLGMRLSEVAASRSMNADDLIHNVLDEAVRNNEAGQGISPKKTAIQADRGTLVGIRINIVLTDELDRSLSKIAESRDMSQSALIAEMLKDALGYEES